MSSSYLNQHGFHVLKLRGSETEMGYQHGRLLRDAIQQGVIPYFKAYLPRVLQPALGKQGAKALQQLLFQTTGKRLLKAFPDYFREHMRALAEGAGLAEQDIAQAFVLPDLFLWLVSKSNGRHLELAPTLGCSSVFAQGAASQGKMLHGRNLDYMGVGHWETQQAILFYQPDIGMPYVSIASAGIPLGGITSMNQAGLTLAVHQHLSCLNVKLGGTPIGIAGDQVMRHATTLAEAVQILDRYPPNVCWTYVIASAEENALLCYETTGTQSRWFIERGERFGYTNFYLDPDLQAQETHLYPSQWRSNLGRYQTIRDSLASQHGQIDANTIANVLANPGHKACRLAQPLAMLFTVSSVVFEPQARRFYVATGPAPTSQRQYWGFDLSTESALDLPPLNGGLADPQSDRAFAAYRQAYIAWFEQGDKGQALLAMEQAAELAPRESIYAYMAGLIALDKQMPDLAIHWLNKALNLGHPDPQRCTTFRLWRARAYDVLGMRKQARTDYQQVLTQLADIRITQAAHKGLRQAWRWQALSIEFNYADLMAA